LIQDHRDLETRYQKLRAGDPDKETVFLKIKFIEDRLRADKFTLMYDGDDMTRPLESHKASLYTNKTFIEDMESKVIR